MDGTREEACNLVTSALREAIENLEQARECMTSWNWTYLSPEDVDETIETLRKLADSATLEAETAR